MTSCSIQESFRKMWFIISRRFLLYPSIGWSVRNYPYFQYFTANDCFDGKNKYEIPSHRPDPHAFKFVCGCYEWEQGLCSIRNCNIGFNLINYHGLSIIVWHSLTDSGKCTSSTVLSSHYVLSLSLSLSLIHLLSQSHTDFFSLSRCISVEHS